MGAVIVVQGNTRVFQDLEDTEAVATVARKVLIAFHVNGPANFKTVEVYREEMQRLAALDRTPDNPFPNWFQVRMLSLAIQHIETSERFWQRMKDSELLVVSENDKVAVELFQLENAAARVMKITQNPSSDESRTNVLNFCNCISTVSAVICSVKVNIKNLNA